MMSDSETVTFLSLTFDRVFFGSSDCLVDETGIFFEDTTNLLLAVGGE